jgi:lipopolysaccharide transport system ATP-binding protein
VATGGRTVLFVSHNMIAVRALCSKAMLLDKGQVIQQGPVDRCIDQYLVRSFDNLSQRWTRPKQESGLKFQEIELRLVGTQPNLVLEIDCRFSGQSVREKAFVAFDLTDSSGVTFMQALPSLEPFIGADKGDRAFRFTIDLPGIVPGDYSVTCWLGPHNTDTFDYLKDALSFTVTDSPSPGRTMPHSKDHGFLVPPSRYQIL